MKTKEKKGSEANEITLRFRGKIVAPEDFRKAVNAFVDLIVQVSQEISQGESTPVWNMSVRTGSNVLAAKPVSDARTAKAAKQTMRLVLSGIRMLERGRADVPHFNRRALQAAKDLGGVLAKPGKQGIDSVEIGLGSGKPLPITQKTSEVVSGKIGVQRQSFGSVEGRLQTITERGSFQFVVYDAISDRGINCFVPQERFKDAHQAFGRRVNVSGIIQYDRSGAAVSIKVDSIRVFRELDELPPIEQFRGILKGA